MKIGSFAALATIGAAVLLTHCLTAEAAEIKLISAGGFGTLMHILGPQFERATGNTLAIKFVDGPKVKPQIDAGEAFDVAIAVGSAMDDLIKEGKIVASTRTDIARRGVGVGVPVGAPKPDISTVEAFRRALLNAKVVAFSSGGSAGRYFSGLLERLGISEQMKSKLKAMPGSTASEAIVKGEADLLVSGNAETIVPGVDLVGLIPAELQDYVVFTAGVGSAAKQPEAANTLIKFLTASEAASLIREKGMEPGAPR
jgi:molybdate transport system substrate-binding protein